ncbi:biotin attachment protein [Microbacterium sp. Root53]|uniref:biotin/lipoyl-containing protein n=1 Tax=Microbacterium sp. Root53 TaxID=1736553 RepID=UPI0006F9C88E|nr:lipoyl domain-containing protein [Microbacterium sp. Root53]KQY97537.1 biotin attachment protein [Microbacterium sp. Root53]
MTDVLFPQMSDRPDATGVIVTWFVQSGETVAEDALIAEVALDKVDAEVLAPASGVITLVAAEDQEVPLGSVIATIA